MGTGGATPEVLGRLSWRLLAVLGTKSESTRYVGQHTHIAMPSYHSWLLLLIGLVLPVTTVLWIFVFL
jgi:hypothetical protein